MKLFKIFLISIFFYFINSFAIKAQQENILVDKISKNLRCLICQGQSVYDSQSDFAISMKTLIKNKIKEGKGEKEIYEFFKTKYGEWIVYDPELSKKTFLLWAFPLILFVFGGLLIVRKVFLK